MPVRDAVRVLALGGRAGETRHAALALAPGRPSAGAIEVTEATESRLVEGHLARFDCLVLCNISRFSRNEAALLHDYVLRGGGLIVFLGDQMQAENYNELLVDDAAHRVFPARFHGTAPTAVEGYPLDPLDYRHAIAAPFRGFRQAGLLTTPIWKYVRLSPLEGSATAIAFSNGEPAIVEGRVGRGRCVVVATAASPDSLDRSTDPPLPWTAMAAWPSFPPLMHEMLRFVLAGQSQARNLVVGDELMGNLPAGIDKHSVTLSGHGIAAAGLPLSVEDGDSAPGQWSFGAAAVSGVYEARLGDDVQRIAVNLDPRESDLTRFDPAMLPSQLRRGAPRSADEDPARTPGQTTSYFRWLLAGVLVLLIVDPCLAWHFGRGRR